MGLKKNNPGCGCCDGVSECEHCSADTPDEVVVEISGITDAGCNCSPINGTFYLPQTGNPCVYSQTYDLDDCIVGGCTVVGFFVSVQFASGYARLQVNLSVTGCGDYPYAYWNSLGGPIDCEAELSPGWGGYFGFFTMTGACGGWNTATVTINPV